MAVKKKKFQNATAIDNPRHTLIHAFQATELKVPAIKSSNLALSFVLFIGSFLLYANSLHNAYALDDLEVITANAYVTKGISGIPEILSTPHLRGYMISPNETYRPLSLVFFAAEYKLWGPNPAVGHFFNVLFFGLCVVLLFLFLDSLFSHQKKGVAFIAALLFAAHPIHTEVVDNVKSFDELLCFFFAFLALNVFLEYARSGKINQLLAGSFAMFLSLISKETTITFIFIVPLIFFFYKSENKKRSVDITAGTLLSAIAFLLVRAYILKINHNTTADLKLIQNALLGAPGTASRIATTILVLGYYVKLMFIPYPLISDYSMNSIPYAHFTDAAVSLSLLTYCGLIVIAGYRFFKFRKDPWAFGILFFLITIALFSNFFFLIASQMSERFTFFASVGFCLLIALALDKWVLKSREFSIPLFMKSKVMLILVPLLFAFSYITLGRNEEWIDNYTLQKSDLGKAPNNSHLNYCIGYAFVSSKYEAEQDPAAKQQILQEGIGYLKKSLAIAPNYSAAQTEIGYAYFLNAQYDSAEVHDIIALSLDSTDVAIPNNMAGIYFTKKNYSGALAMSLKVISINPNYVKSYSNAGLCYYYLQKFDSGVICLNKAISLDPGFGRSYETMALIYNATGKIDSAKKYEAIAKRYNHLFKL